MGLNRLLLPGMTSTDTVNHLHRQCSYGHQRIIFFNECKTQSNKFIHTFFEHVLYIFGSNSDKKD